MKNNQPVQNNILAFSLEGATGPEIDAPSRFARALKQARARKGWTQTQLAAHLDMTKRTIVSWETAARTPSIGMVMYLLDVLLEGELSLSHALLSSYILDDLEHQIQRKDPKGLQQDALARQLRRVISHVEHLAENRGQSSLPQSPTPPEPQSLSTAGDQQGQIQTRSSDLSLLQPLFSLLDQLRQHPDLIPVASDFIRELAPMTEYTGDG